MRKLNGDVPGEAGPKTLKNMLGKSLLLYMTYPLAGALNFEIKWTKKNKNSLDTMGKGSGFMNNGGSKRIADILRSLEYNQRPPQGEEKLQIGGEDVGR